MIEQHYLSKDPWVRVRRCATETTAQGWLTIKGKGTLTRPEFEYPIPVEDTFELARMAKFGRVCKFRRKHGPWEIDEFRGDHAGLWLAEIELPSEDSVFDKPEWLGEEVTYDTTFTNAYMAEHGLPPGV